MIRFMLAWLVVWVCWLWVSCLWLGLPFWSWSVFGVLVLTGMLANLEKYLWETRYKGRY